MEIKEIKFIEIKPSEGMALTNGETYSEPNTSVSLGVNDSPDNWWEITEEEYNEAIRDSESEEGEEGMK